MKALAARVTMQLRELLRLPAYWVPSLLFPAMLFSFFGVGPARDHPHIAPVILASWSVFAVQGIAFYQFGVGIAQDRVNPWQTSLRVLPAGPLPGFAAQAVTALLFAAAAVAGVWLAGGLLLPEAAAVRPNALLLALLLLGGVPFVFLGIAIGYLVEPRAAVPVANLVHLPLAFAGGLWLPPSRLPDLVQAVSPYLPTRMYAELVWAAARDEVPALQDAGGLVLTALGAALLAGWAWRHDEQRRHG